MAKLTYHMAERLNHSHAHGKRDLVMWQKRPNYMTKETYYTAINNHYMAIRTNYS